MLRVYKRFGGMRDLALICGDIRDSDELKPEAAGGNFHYEREQDIVFLWGWDKEFVNWNTGFQLTSAETGSWQK